MRFVLGLACFLSTASAAAEESPHRHVMLEYRFNVHVGDKVVPAAVRYLTDQRPGVPKSEGDERMELVSYEAEAELPFSILLYPHVGFGRDKSGHRRFGEQLFRLAASKDKENRRYYFSNDFRKLDVLVCSEPEDCRLYKPKGSDEPPAFLYRNLPPDITADRPNDVNEGFFDYLAFSVKLSPEHAKKVGVSYVLHFKLTDLSLMALTAPEGMHPSYERGHEFATASDPSYETLPAYGEKSCVLETKDLAVRTKRCDLIWLTPSDKLAGGPITWENAELQIIGVKTGLDIARDSAAWTKFIENYVRNMLFSKDAASAGKAWTFYQEDKKPAKTRYEYFSALKMDILGLQLGLLPRTDDTVAALEERFKTLMAQETDLGPLSELSDVTYNIISLRAQVGNTDKLLSMMDHCANYALLTNNSSSLDGAAACYTMPKELPETEWQKIAPRAKAKYVGYACAKGRTQNCLKAMKN